LVKQATARPPLSPSRDLSTLRDQVVLHGPGEAFLSGRGFLGGQ